MRKSPSSSVIRVFALGVALSLCATSIAVLAETVDSEQARVSLGRSRLRALKNWPETSAPAPVPDAATSAASDAGLGQIKQVCLECQTDYPFSALVTDNFVLLHCGNTAWASSTGALLERTYERFYKTFEKAGFLLKQPADRMTWVCFGKTEDYHQYAWQTERRDVSALEGYYSAQTNRVALYDTAPPLLPTAPAPGKVVTAWAENEPALGAAPQLLDAVRTVHEAAHQLAFNSGLQRRGVMYPFWLSEGLATAFENDPADSSSASEVSARRRRLLDARAVNALIPLKEFATMTRIPMDDMGAVYDAYAQAWGFFTFLLQRHRSELNHYVGRLHSVPRGRRSTERMRREFTDSFGAIREVDQEWMAYLDQMQSAK